VSNLDLIDVVVYAIHS